MDNSILDYEKQKPKKKLWLFKLILNVVVVLFFLSFYFLNVRDASLAYPFAFIGVSIPIGFVLYFFLSAFFQNDSWSLRDIYRFRNYFYEGFMGFSLAFALLSAIFLPSVNIPEPLDYNLNQPSFLADSLLDFKTAQAVHRAYIFPMLLLYLLGIRFFMLLMIDKKAKELTFESVSIPNEEEVVRKTGEYYTYYNRYFGDQYLNKQGDLIESEKLMSKLMEMSKEDYTWPSHGFLGRD
ncbi:hypothetical protein [Algoriphagus sediminis]|uniref:Uncharacterized protein n=1 Tax=Algoriphagus sediminis TaxID=3057113 RepID=A0ABT7YGM6_9BACT|nr:hypothetical protein [Algoriphagus sediminis]MDN3205662.1 hypothetical protein [Algoriphagus sediminis]